MRRITRLTAVGAIALTALLWGSDSYAAPLPAVATVIEGRDSDTGDAVLVLVGTRVNKFKTFALLDAIGADAGALTRVLKSRSLLVLTLPPDTESGDYELVMTYGRGGSSSLTVPISVTRFETEEGSVDVSALSEPLLTDLADADSLEGAPRVYFEDAASILSGVLDTERYSAYDDLVSELKIGSAVDQLAAGDHDHDDRYFTQAVITDPGVLNDAANPLEWTKLKNVPDGLLDGTAHDHDALYHRKAELSDAGVLNTADNPVDWTKLKSVPPGFADGIDADTTYTAGDGLDLTGTAFSTRFDGTGSATTSSRSDHDHDAVYAKSVDLATPGTINASGNPMDWTKLKSVPTGFADGVDADTTYSAGANVSLTGTVFSVPSFPWASLAGVPSGFADGTDDDTRYSGGTNVELAGTVFSVPSFPWADLAGIPTGFADGIDNDTTYDAGAGLARSGTTFSTLFGGSGSASTSSRSDHDHDGDYFTKSQLNTSGAINAASNPVDWTRLKNVPADFADGTDDGALWTESGADLYRNAGDVGIGTTSPTAKLHVNGNGVLFEGTSGSGAFPTTGSGRRVMWHPGTASFRAGQVTGTQWDPGNVGPYSVAFGFNTTARAQYSAAFGLETIAGGSGSFAAGFDSEATGNYATALTYQTKATGNYSLATGFKTTASGLYATSTGYETFASGQKAFAANDRTTASGYSSTALGWNTEAQPFASLVIGRWNVVEGIVNGWTPTDPLFVAGNGSNASSRSNALTLLKNGDLSIAGDLTIGGNATVTGSLDLNDLNGLALVGTHGSGTIPVTGAGSRFMWYPRKSAVRGGAVAGSAWNDTNIGDWSTAFGHDTTAKGAVSTALGWRTTASGIHSAAIGSQSTASGDRSTAMGDQTTASGDNSTALGDLTTASGFASTAMGFRSRAEGTRSTALGVLTQALGSDSIAAGTTTTASGRNSVSLGVSTESAAYGSLAIGRYNSVSTGWSPTSWVPTDPVFQIGNGASTIDRSDAFAVFKNGDVGVGRSLFVDHELRSNRSLWVQGDYGAVLGGTFGQGGFAGSSGSGTRMVWYPKKAAFRAGRLGVFPGSSLHWTDSRIGDYSTALGMDCAASGFGTAAIGVGVEAKAMHSTVFGRWNRVTGDRVNWVDTDPLLVVGNGGGSLSRSNALTLLKNGDLSNAGSLMAEGTLGVGSIPATGAGVRFMWYPKKAAVRAGRAVTEWDDTAIGDYSTAFGLRTKATADGSTALGNLTEATGDYSTALGTLSKASGASSLATGVSTLASGGFSTAMGHSCDATANYAIAMGQGTTASGLNSMAMGKDTTASARDSVAFGNGTTALGNHAVAMGIGTTARAYGSVVMGRYNNAASTTYSSPTSWAELDFLLVAGNGSSTTSRSDALILRKNGDLFIAGDLTEASDARLKKDIVPLGPVLDRLDAVRGVTYEFIHAQKNPAGRHIGLVAQEVQAAFPELVEQGPAGTLSVAYGKFTAVLLEAVKEQQAEIASQREVDLEQRETISIQRREIEDLKARLARIEALLRPGSKSKDD